MRKENKKEKSNNQLDKYMVKKLVKEYFRDRCCLRLRHFINEMIILALIALTTIFAFLVLAIIFEKFNVVPICDGVIYGLAVITLIILIFMLKEDPLININYANECSILISTFNKLKINNKASKERAITLLQQWGATFYKTLKTFTNIVFVIGVSIGSSLFAYYISEFITKNPEGEILEKLTSLAFTGIIFITISVLAKIVEHHIPCGRVWKIKHICAVYEYWKFYSNNSKIQYSSSTKTVTKKIATNNKQTKVKTTRKVSK